MHAPTRRVFLPLLLSMGLMATGAQAGGEVAEGPQQLPPPPGPYVSSRPNLQTAPAVQQGSSNRLPFIGDVPEPTMPMRYMPLPQQLPSPPPWWRGPMGR